MRASHYQEDGQATYITFDYENGVKLKKSNMSNDDWKESACWYMNTALSLHGSTNEDQQKSFSRVPFDSSGATPTPSSPPHCNSPKPPSPAYIPIPPIYQLSPSTYHPPQFQATCP
jgi:hypothetical protein